MSVNSAPTSTGWQQRVQARFTAALAWLGSKVRDSKVRDLTLLTLPYQVSAVLTALVAVGYTRIFEWVAHAQIRLVDGRPGLIFIIAPVFFLTSWWLVRRFSPMAGGSGIPQLLAAVEVANDHAEDRSWRFLNARIIVVKVISSMFLAFGGGAIGPEGPMLQIAGSVYRVVHKLLPPFWPHVSRRVMMITGGAAGLSAAFNTPLGGVVFAVEELTKTHITQFRTAVFSSVIIAGMTTQQLLGNYLGPYLGYPRLDRVGPAFMYEILPIAICSGVAGALFCKVLLALDKWRRTLQGTARNAAWVVACALLFATCVHFFGPRTMGSGKLLLGSYLFDAQVDPSWRDVGGRILGPITSFSTGGAGGIFAPSLSGGAAIGGWIGHLFHPSRGEFNVLVLAGMVAFMTGVSRSPFTSAILVLEMTDRHSVIFQLMYAAMIASLVSQMVDGKSYYERMKDRILKAIGPGVTPKEADKEDGMAGFGLG